MNDNAMSMCYLHGGSEFVNPVAVRIAVSRSRDDDNPGVFRFDHL